MKFEKVKTESFLLKTLPLLAVLLFSAIAFTNFLSFYFFSPSRAEHILSSTSILFSTKSFFFTFFIFFFLFLFSAYFMIFTSDFYAKILFFVTGIIAAVLMAYSTDQLFTIKIFIYIAFLICTVYGYPYPIQQGLGISSLIFFVFIHFLPVFPTSGISATIRFRGVKPATKAEEPSEMCLLSRYRRATCMPCGIVNGSRRVPCPGRTEKNAGKERRETTSGRES